MKKALKNQKNTVVSGSDSLLTDFPKIYESAVKKAEHTRNK